MIKRFSSAPEKNDVIYHEAFLNPCNIDHYSSSIKK